MERGQNYPGSNLPVSLLRDHPVYFVFQAGKI
jgi:hypothetical protein